jgi:hypothetical protein
MSWYKPDPEEIAARDKRRREELEQVLHIQDTIVQALVAAGEPCSITAAPRWRRFGSALGGFAFHYGDHYYGRGFSLYCTKHDKTECLGALTRYQAILTQSEYQPIIPPLTTGALGSLGPPCLSYRLLGYYF